MANPIQSNQSLDRIYINFIQTLCESCGKPDMAKPLIEGFGAYRNASIRPLYENGFIDKIKQSAQNVLLPIIAAVCIGAGNSNAGELSQCETKSDCIDILQEIKLGNKPITRQQIQQIKELAETDNKVEYCKIMPHGILCKQSTMTIGNSSGAGAVFTPFKHIDGVPDEVYSIGFTNTTFHDGGGGRNMTFSTDDGSVIIYKAIDYSNGRTEGSVMRFDEFTGLSEEKYDYQSVLNFINSVYNACKH